MTAFDIAVSVGSLITAGAGMFYVEHLVRNSGAARPHNPEGAQRLIDTAPYQLLDEVRDKSGSRPPKAND